MFKFIYFLFLSILSIDTLDNLSPCISFSDKIKEEKVLFIDVDENSNDLDKFEDSNINEGILNSYYYFEEPVTKKILRGELYRTKEDNDQTIIEAKKYIRNNIYQFNYYSPNYDEQEIYCSKFNISKSFIPISDKTTVRTMSCSYKDEFLGTFTDFENLFILNNPNNKNSLYLLVTHQTYLSPRQSSDRNYKGVGVELKLKKIPSSNITIVDYAPTTQGPSKTISFNGTIQGGANSDGLELNTSFGFSYSKEVASPSVASKGNIGAGIVDISFNYVEPGSWYGQFCEYNSSETFQCSLVVVECNKSQEFLEYDSQVISRFQKYQNWPFPWIDEYYSINLDSKLKTSDLVSILNRG